MMAGRRKGRSLSVLPLDHRQFHEPSMKACVRPRDGDSSDELAREAEPS
jgi:hypothetical protein